MICPLKILGVHICRWCTHCVLCVLHSVCTTAVFIYYLSILCWLYNELPNGDNKVCLTLTLTFTWCWTASSSMCWYENEGWFPAVHLQQPDGKIKSQIWELNKCFQRNNFTWLLFPILRDGAWYGYLKTCCNYKPTVCKPKVCNCITLRMIYQCLSATNLYSFFSHFITADKPLLF